MPGEMKPVIIAAVAENGVIGKDNTLIWHLPHDLKRFKRLTSGHHVIMGRKTFESVGRPLPHRTNIVVSRQSGYQAEGCLVVSSLEEALQAAQGDVEPYIIGGAEIYAQGLAYAKKLEITRIHRDFEGDTYFPSFDAKVWKLWRGEKHPADADNPYPFSYLTYLRIDPERHNQL